MTKLIALIAAGSFATTALFAGEHGEGIRNVQNERKEMKMACSIPLDDLNRDQIHGGNQSRHDSGAIREVQAEIRPRAKRENGRLIGSSYRIKASRREQSRRVSRTDIQDKRHHFRARRSKRDWKRCRRPAPVQLQQRSAPFKTSIANRR